MTDVAVLELQAKTDGMIKAKTALDDVTQAAMRTESAAQDAGTAVTTAGASAAKSSGNVRMLGQQLSQVAQQGAATGQWMNALSIQAADIGMSFGAVGIALGVLTTIGMPLLVNWLSDGKSKAVDLDTAIGTLTDSMGDYQSFMERASTSTAELSEKFGDFAGQIRGFSEFMASVALDQTFDDLNAAMDPLRDKLGDIPALIDAVAMAQAALNKIDKNEYPQQWLDARDAVELFQSQLDSAAGAMGLNADQATRLKEALAAISAAKTMDQIATAAGRAQSILAEVRNSAGSLPAPLRAAAGALDDMMTAAAEAASAAGIAADEVRRIGQEAAGGVGAVYSLVDALLQAQGAASAVRYDALTATTGSGPDAVRSRLNGGGNFTPVVRGAGLATPRASGGGGRGGGGTDSYASDLDALVKSLETERETTDAWYADSMKLLEDRRAMEILGAQGHADALLAIEQELQSRRADLQSQQISDTAGLFGSLADIAQSGGKKMQRIVAGFEAVQGVMNAYGAAIKALNTPGITLAGRYAAYASVLAAGLRGVAAIRSAGGGGGGGHSGGSASIGSATAAPATVPDRQIRVNIQGDGLFADALRGSIRQIADALGDERNIGGFVVA